MLRGLFQDPILQTLPQHHLTKGPTGPEVHVRPIRCSQIAMWTVADKKYSRVSAYPIYLGNVFVQHILIGLGFNPDCGPFSSRGLLDVHIDGLQTTADG